MLLANTALLRAPVGTLASVSPTALRALRPGQAALLPAATVATLSPYQTALLLADSVAGLGVNVSALAPAALDALLSTKAAAQAVPGAAVARWTAGQVHAVAAAHIRNLCAAQVRRLSDAALRGLSAAQRAAVEAVNGSGAACAAPSISCDVTEWGPWSRCSAGCGANGTRWRQRQVLLPAANGGLACPALNQSAPCTTPCPHRGLALWEKAALLAAAVAVAAAALVSLRYAMAGRARAAESDRLKRQASRRLYQSVAPTSPLTFSASAAATGTPTVLTATATLSPRSVLSDTGGDVGTAAARRSRRATARAASDASEDAEAARLLQDRFGPGTWVAQTDRKPLSV